MSNNEVAGVIRELKGYQVMLDDLNATIEGLKDQVKEYMTAHAVEEVSIDVYKVRYQTIKSNRIDTASLKKIMPQVAEQFTKETITKRLSIA